MFRLYLSILVAAWVFVLPTISALAHGVSSSGEDFIAFHKDAREEAAAYWTDERLKAAQPMPLPIIDENTLRKMMETAPEMKVTPDVPKYAPASNLRAEGEEIPYGIPSHADIKKFPYSSGGKLFFTIPGDGDYYCSGQFSGDYNMILTAAHCVRDHTTGAYYTNLKFVRAYNAGVGQSVLANCVATKTEWFTGANPPKLQFDYAWIQSTTKSTGGHMGWHTLLLKSSWTAIGYPRNYGLGLTMQYVYGTKGMVSVGIAQMVGNPMGNGSDGGAWIGDLGVKNNAIGLNSFAVSSTPGVVYGPYFDYNFYYLYWFVHRGCQN